jgi:hypothetical protein
MAPLALVGRPGVVSISRTIYEQAVSYLRMTRSALVPCGRKMLLSGLFGGGEDNIHA